jgi:hypothetical protein
MWGRMVSCAPIVNRCSRAQPGRAAQAFVPVNATRLPPDCIHPPIPDRMAGLSHANASRSKISRLPASLPLAFPPLAGLSALRNPPVPRPGRARTGPNPVRHDDRHASLLNFSTGGRTAAASNCCT